MLETIRLKDLFWVPSAFTIQLTALAGLALVTWWALGLIRSLHKWLRVGWGCRQVPSAPNGNFLLGHVLALAPPNCAWERMYSWLKKKNAPGGILKVRILHRTGILVGDPLAIKRIFQVIHTIFKLIVYLEFQSRILCCICLCDY